MWRIKIDILYYSCDWQRNAPGTARLLLRIVANNSNTLDAVDDNELTSADDNDGTHHASTSEELCFCGRQSVVATCNGVPRFEDDGGTKEEAQEFVDCASRRQERE
ncbi:hypothetical protein B0H10DRAFT_1962231 [Mycena sp. CBHHK59/15]|nr:hypothetical protein B0H10DRAFT_1962231 [Mycena sp. CBHHK59/15]